MSHLQYSSYEGFGKRSVEDLHYSQAVRIGDTIKISGQGGWDRLTVAIPEDFEAQVAQAFDNIEHTLRDAGGKGWEEVYMVRSYTTSLGEEELAVITKHFRKYCPNHQPIWTAIGVAALGLPQMKVEIEVAAHLQK